MSQIVPVIFHEGMLVPQIELEGIQEGQQFEILIPEPDEWTLLQEQPDPWLGFVSIEDALQVVAQTAGQFGPLSAELVEAIAMDKTP